MKIFKNILTNNKCFKVGKKNIVKGLMIHSVGCPQPSALAFIRQWNVPNYNKCCVHALIEPNGNVYQTLPWNYRGWHCYCGFKGSGNLTHIGVEMTEPSTIKYVGGASWVDLNPHITREHVIDTYLTAVELFAYLCKMYKLDPLADGVIISHSEGHKRQIASNHGDVEHIWARFGLTMEQFRKDIKAAMMPKNETEEDEEMKIYKKIEEVPQYWRPQIQQLINEGAIEGDGKGNINLPANAAQALVIMLKREKLKK